MRPIRATLVKYISFLDRLNSFLAVGFQWMAKQNKMSWKLPLADVGSSWGFMAGKRRTSYNRTT